MANGLDAQQMIFASNPDDRRAFEALEEHFFLDGDWEALVDLYRARLASPEMTEDSAQQAPLLFRLGQILEERILDTEAASEVYWTLARLDPTNRPALRQLRGLHARNKKWDLVLQIAELESATTMPPYDRAAFETELGQTWQDHLGDADEARIAYERALEANPEFPPALEGLAALHQEAGRLTEAAEILARLTDRLRGPERAPVWIALGTLYARDLGEPARARECFAHALEDDPFQPPAVEWALLLAMADEDWEAVSELLERRFDLAAGARQRAAVAVEASQIQLNYLESPARARAWTNRAIELAPDELSVFSAGSAEGRPKRFRFGFLASSDNHTARPGTGYKEVDRREMTEAGEGGFGSFASMLGESEPRSIPIGSAMVKIPEFERFASFLGTGGLVAVHSSGRDRHSIWRALERREVYGTSGDRILLWFDLRTGPGENVPMGSEVALVEAPRFRVRAAGAFHQKPGCPEYSTSALSPARLDHLCRGECYNPSDERKSITRIEVVRIRPQVSPGEPVGDLIEDPWRVLHCDPDAFGCSVEFEDPEYPAAGRDTIYYVRAIQEPSPTVNGAQLRCEYDEAGRCVSVSPCYGDPRTDYQDDCLAESEERAWSSPIFLHFPGQSGS